MRPVKRFLRRLRAWVTGQDADERLQAEIEDHLAHQTAEFERAGLPRAEARRQALLKFGGVESTRERWREERGLPALDTLVRDIRHALRRLRMAPAFTTATVLVLALGIGATTAIFTLVHSVLLKSLPVRDPGELYRLGREARCCYMGGYTQGQEFSLVSYQLYAQLRDRTPGFAELAAFSAGLTPLGVRRAGMAERAETYPGEFVSGNYFAMFGVAAYAGRTLTPADDEPGAPPAAVMSHRLWVQRFGGAPSIVGSVFNLNEKPVTVVGITPPGFFGDTLRSAPPDFFLPLNTEPLLNSDSALAHYETHWLALIGRIQPGASPTSLEARMRLELTRWLRSHWGEMSANDRVKIPEQTLFLRPGGAGITSMREQYQHWLEILMAVTGCALLIVCANVATLMLVRGLERRRQTSLAIALGARRSRVVREPLIESLLLSVGGGVAGLAIAFAGTRVILQVVFPALPGAGGVPIDAWPSTPVLLFACAVSLATGLAFGMAPAWMATRADPMDALRGTGRSTARTGSLPRTVLIVFQATLSLVLLSAAGMLTAALHGLENQAFGFEQNNRLVAQVNPRLVGYRPDQLPRSTIESAMPSRACLESPAWRSASTRRSATISGARTSGWMDTPRPDRMTTPSPPGTASRRITSLSSATRSCEGAVFRARIPRRRATWPSSTKRLRGSSSKARIHLASASVNTGSDRSANTKSSALRRTLATLARTSTSLSAPCSICPKRSTTSRKRRRPPTRIPARTSCTTSSLQPGLAFSCRRQRSARPSGRSIPRCRSRRFGR